jgi:hypothetical protein
MTEWITHMTPTELLARVRADRAAFAGLWEGLSDAQMTQRPGVQADWSVKDLIAHILFWERLIIDNEERLRRGEALPDVEDFDAINAQVFEENKNRVLSDLQEEFEAQQTTLEGMIQGLSEDDINNTQRFPQLNGRPFLNDLIGNTFGHYAEHSPDLEQYVDSLKT